jgi:hypothetical protein
MGKKTKDELISQIVSKLKKMKVADLESVLSGIQEGVIPAGIEDLNWAMLRAWSENQEQLMDNPAFGKGIQAFYNQLEQSKIFVKDAIREKSYRKVAALTGKSRDTVYRVMSDDPTVTSRTIMEMQEKLSGTG